MEKTWKPTTAGILTIIEGSMRIAFGIGLIVAGRWVGALGGLDWSSWIEEWARVYGPGTADIQSMLTRILGRWHKCHQKEEVGAGTGRFYSIPPRDNGDIGYYLCLPGEEGV